MTEYKMFIANSWVEAQGGETFTTLNPYTGEPWAQVSDGGETDVNKAVAAAREAFDRGPWKDTTGKQRAELMRRLATILERDAADLAACETRDNGKLLREMEGQCRVIPDWFHYYAGLADKIEGEVIPSDKPNFLVYTRKEPIGVVAAIVPWNSPLLLLSWKLAPALAAGCTLVVKPSEQTPVSALELARRVAEAGFPPGVFNVITGLRPETGAALVSHAGVDKVAFTGSTKTGTQIVRTAAGNLTPVSLELGGKSPNIVFDDADPESAANGVIAGIFAATGQTCIAGSRLLVQRSMQDELLERLVARANTIKLGDPTSPETEMGPVAYADQRDKVLAVIENGVDEGAEIACGGKLRDELGDLFVEPTILTRVTNDMQVAREEIFGPVLSVIPFDTEDEAVEIANDTRFGLAAGIWTTNIHRAHRVAHRIRAGTVWVNAYRVVSVSTPFGGYKASGWGRENGLEAISEFTQTKSVWVELDGATRDPFTLG